MLVDWWINVVGVWNTRMGMGIRMEIEIEIEIGMYAIIRLHVMLKYYITECQLRR